jgi:hypothetical protein
MILASAFLTVSCGANGSHSEGPAMTDEETLRCGSLTMAYMRALIDGTIAPPAAQSASPEIAGATYAQIYGASTGMGEQEVYAKFMAEGERLAGAMDAKSLEKEALQCIAAAQWDR